MTLGLEKCSERFGRLAFRASHFATNPGAYMFTPRALHVLPPVVTAHARIAYMVNNFYRDHTHRFEVNKGKALVLDSARHNIHRAWRVRTAYKRAVAKWGKVRVELTQALYKEVFGDK